MPIGSKVRLQAAGNRTRIALLLAAFLTGAPLLHAQAKAVASSLAVQVKEESAVEIRNGAAILKIRLNPGVTASLWGDQVCTLPNSGEHIIASSGTFTFSLNDIKQAENAKGDEESFICLRSSDGLLQHSVPIKLGPPPTGTKLSATESTPQSTSVTVSMPAGVESSATMQKSRAIVSSL